MLFPPSPPMSASVDRSGRRSAATVPRFAAPLRAPRPTMLVLPSHGRPSAASRSASRSCAAPSRRIELEELPMRRGRPARVGCSATCCRLFVSPRIGLAPALFRHGRGDSPSQLPLVRRARDARAGRRRSASRSPQLTSFCPPADTKRTIAMPSKPRARRRGQAELRSGDADRVAGARREKSATPLGDFARSRPPAVIGDVATSSASPRRSWTCTSRRSPTRELAGRVGTTGGSTRCAVADVDG